MEHPLSPLSETPKNISLIQKKDGSTYTVRNNRDRYLFPDEWIAIEKTLKKESHIMFFNTLINSGARIMEALHLKPSNFDFERGTISFSVVKQRKAKKQYYATKSGRRFFVSPIYLNKMRRFINKNRIDTNQYIFLDNSKLPSNYDSLDNVDKKPFYRSPQSGYQAMFKRKLLKAGIKDPEQLSVHNLRKTYGNWMRAFNIEMVELCYRMGHDMDTFMAHYGSSLIFTQDERRKIERIFGTIR